MRSLRDSKRRGLVAYLAQEGDDKEGEGKIAWGCPCSHQATPGNCSWAEKQGHSCHVTKTMPSSFTTPTAFNPFVCEHCK